MAIAGWLFNRADKSVRQSGGRSDVTNEAFARVKIDRLLVDTDWKLTDGRSVRYEYPQLQHLVERVILDVGQRDGPALCHLGNPEPTFLR